MKLNGALPERRESARQPEVVCGNRGAAHARQGRSGRGRSSFTGIRRGDGRRFVAVCPAADAHGPLTAARCLETVSDNKKRSLTFSHIENGRYGAKRALQGGEQP